MLLVGQVEDWEFKSRTISFSDMEAMHNLAFYGVVRMKTLLLWIQENGKEGTGVSEKKHARDTMVSR